MEVLGDLTENEAKEFLLGDGEKGTWAGIINEDPSSPLPPVSEEQWTEIFARCGGNILLLKSCAQDARSEGNWESALKDLVAMPGSTIVDAFKPSVLMHRNAPPLWTKDQWKMVLEKITAAPHHAVLRDELVAALERSNVWLWPWSKRFDGNAILLSMMEYKLLALRPYSTLARDLPEEVFGDDASEIVVTLPSAAHVFEAKQELLKRKSGK